MQTKYDPQEAGFDFKAVIERMAVIVKIDPKEVLVPGKQTTQVKARNLVCFRSIRKLSMTTVDIAGRLSMSQSAVSKASYRGEKMIRENQLKLIE